MSTSSSVLSDLKPGQSAVIQEITRASKPTVQRLQEIGLLPGTRVELVRQGGLGGPLQIAFCGSCFMIREELASCISIIQGVL